ncbi:MAG TPA: pectate lyase [Dictyoglomaceae bacterium]|nr:pectate lyase [Dictyoglomaceae bacterium]
MKRRLLLVLSLILLLLSFGYSQEQVLSLQDKPIGFGEKTTGGMGGKVVSVTNIEDLKKYAQAQDPYIILVDGVIDTNKESTQVNVASNKTIIGVTPDASIVGWGINLKKVDNVVIRNLTIKNIFESSKNDAITIETSSNIWIDHCTLSSDMVIVPERENEKDKVDALCDIIKASSGITISWNIFENSWKCTQVGSSDSSTVDVDARVTYHHNIFRNTNSRNPSIRFGVVHIFNNYYKNILLYSIASRMGAKVIIENNYFENVPLPITTQFESPQDGYVLERGNLYIDCGDNNITQTLKSYSFPYSYTLDPADNLPEILLKGAGAGKKVLLP